MGRIYIPETTFLHQILTFERLMQSLAEIHQEPNGNSVSSYGRHRNRRRCCMSGRALTGCPGFQPWFYTTVNIGNYRPAEVSVKVENGHVIIHGKREEKSGDDFDFSESRRTVKLPEALDRAKVKCFLRTDGRVLIKARAVDRSCSEQSPKKNTETEEAIKYDRSDEQTNPTTVVDDQYLAETTDGGASEISDETSLGKDAQTDEKETGETMFNVTENVHDSLHVDAGDDAVAERDIEERISADAMAAGRQPSPAPSEDFSFIDEPIIKTVVDFQQSTDTREEPELDGQSLGADQDLNPLADSVRIVENGQRKTFEVSLNLKDFDAENMSVRFVDSELFVDAKKEERADGVYSLQEVHRKYTVPEDGILDSARAQVTSNGIVTVKVPLEAEEKADAITVPIVQLE